MPISYQFDVFISYNRKDENFVEFLTGIFDKYDIKYFLDKTELKLYDKLDSTLKNNVLKSRFLLSLISPAYLNSYWCLFEAIEAIQGQSIELKFLPIFLRYGNADPQFNEDYVIERLSELSQQIEDFEIKMIKHKAYELSGKIDKLNFIKTNLPKIFTQSHVNIYPVFEVFNQQSVLKNLENLINYINPDINAILNSVELTFDQNVNYEYNKPALYTLPKIKWSTKVGKVKWKNIPIILGNDIYIGTCGEVKNSPDPSDGIYCIDFLSGKIKWFTRVSSDVNSLFYNNGSLIFSCIDSSVYCISAKDGALKWQIFLDTPVFANPFIVHDTFLLEKLFLATYGGKIFLLEINTGKIENSWDLGHKIRANVLVVNEKDGKFSETPYMYFSTEDGFVFKIYHDFLSKQLKIKWSQTYDFPDKHSETGNSRCIFYSSPTEYNNQVIQTFVRETYYDYPAVLSINKIDGSINWIATDPEHLYGSFGNVRTNPLIIKDTIIIADAYSNSILSLNANTGKFEWSVDTGRRSFEQWSSPILYKDYIFIARHEGHLNKVDFNSRKKEWSIYLGDHSDAGIVVDSSDFNLEKQQVWWDLKKGFPIYSTPVINKNHLIIGTDEGFLFCISNIV